MTTVKDRYKCKIVITDKITGEEVVYNLDNFNSGLANDLDTVPTISGDFLAPPMYSKGYHVEVTGYIENPYVQKEFKEAIEEAQSRVKTIRSKKWIFTKYNYKYL